MLINLTSYLAICDVADDAASTDLCEESPPLPVTQLQVGGAVPLENLQSTELLLLLSKGPDALQQGEEEKKS